MRSRLAFVRREEQKRGPREEPLFVSARCHDCGGTVRMYDPRRLREVRLAAGLTLSQIARVIGCSSRHVDDIELGNRACTERVRACYMALGRLNVRKVAVEEVRRLLVG